MKNKFLKNLLLIVVSAGCLLWCALLYMVREKQLKHLNDVEENLPIYSVSDGCSEDELGPSIENSQLWVDAPKEITMQNDNYQGYKITQNSEKIDRNNFLEYSIVNYPEIEFMMKK